MDTKNYQRGRLCSECEFFRRIDELCEKHGVDIGYCVNSISDEYFKVFVEFFTCENWKNVANKWYEKSELETI